MLFNYPNIGGVGEIIVDDAGRDFIQRADAIQKKVGAIGWDTQRLPIVSWAPEAVPADLGARGLVYFYGLPISTQLKRGAFAVDALSVLKYPEACLQEIVIGTNLKLDFDPWTWKFEDPDDEIPTLEDWQQPNSILGPPLASMPGHFVFKNGGQAPGSKIRGASGRNYELARLPSLFASYAWKAL